MGLGKVYYNSLGHHNDIFDIPEVLEMTKRGLIWASEGKVEAKEKKQTADQFLDNGKM